MAASPKANQIRPPLGWLTLSFALLIVFLWFGIPIIRDQWLLLPTPTLPEILPTPLPIDTLAPSDSASQASLMNVALGESIAPQNGSNPDGVIVFAMSDGPFVHLFAFHPTQLPLSRLTNHPWDDLHPAISPDGNRIAYASRRNGYWDIYILDLRDGNLTRVTDTPEYDGWPTWSPDGQWLAYETYTNGNLDIFIQSLSDLSQPPIPLTDTPSADHSPAWSPLGQEIAFVSDRNGQDEVWTARLDQIGERYTNISLGVGSPARSPRWSPDGRFLTWGGQNNAADFIFLWDSSAPQKPAVPALAGHNSIWSPDGKVVLVRQTDFLQDSLAGFELSSQKLALPFSAMPAAIHGMDWKGGQINELIPHHLVDSPATLPSLYAAQITLAPQSPPNRFGIVPLTDVNVPYPFLHDAVDESFIALRREAARQSGWDVLGNLENAYLPITEPPHPGSVDEWLLTGRAFAINPLPIQAGWMTITREERGGQTFWRIFIRARYQDGSQGLPMRERPWSLDARYNGDARAYEQGGALIPIPEGYWIDFTELAGRFGWQPVPALQNWRTFYPAARFNQLVKTDGLNWTAAMAQFYPPEALQTPTSIPTLTLTPTISPTIRFYRTATSPPSPTPTSQPTRRPTWTPLPGDNQP